MYAKTHAKIHAVFPVFPVHIELSLAYNDSQITASFLFVDLEDLMRRKQIQPTMRRTVRYVLLLTPGEMELARRVAEAEFRSVPDFLRRHIHSRATTLINTSESTNIPSIEK